MKYKLLKHQDEFLYSNKIHTGLVGGFRSGKTFAGALKTVSKKMQYPNVDVAYYLPNYPLIRDIAYPYFDELLTNQRISFDLNKQDKIFSTDLGKIILRSMHQPEFIIGYEVGYSLVDEADILPTHKMDIAYKKILSRNSIRLPDQAKNSTDFVSTPEGFKFLYNFFKVNHNSSKHLINARTKDNPYISESYIQTLKDEYTEEELMAYLDGQFVNLTSGAVARSFDRFEHDSMRTIKDKDVLHIGMDFNVTKMSAVVHVHDRDIDVVTAVDEFTNIYDTSEMSKKIKERYPKHKIIIYPDASGAARKSSGYSDFDILKMEGFAIFANKSNPKVKDRISKVNKGFESSKYLVNTEMCPKYTESLEQLAYKNNEVDKSSGLDHVFDAGTYTFYHIGNAFIPDRKSKLGYEVPQNRIG